VFGSERMERKENEQMKRFGRQFLLI